MALTGISNLAVCCGDVSVENNKKCNVDIRDYVDVAPGCNMIRIKSIHLVRKKS